MIKRYTSPEMGRIFSEENRFNKMLQVELLVCEALSLKGKIPERAFKVIKQKARFHLGQIQKIERRTKHDLVAFLQEVSSGVGPESRFIHFGLTSNDVLDTASASLLKEASDILIKDLENLSEILSKKAIKYKKTICVGRTHGVHAEPTTFGLKLALMFEENKRNLARMKEAKKMISFGKVSGAVGNFAHIEPFVQDYVCKKLRLYPSPISSQVLPRDRHAQFITTLALIGSSLERFALEIRNLQRTETQEVEEPFSRGQKGSSAMPHKRNPVRCERICGLARLLRTNGLAAMENVALWHERDISHSSVERIIIPDSCCVLDFMLKEFAEIMDGLIVYPERMRKNLDQTKGLVYSQRLLLELINKGLSRDKAYDLVQRNAMHTWQRDTSFRDSVLKDKATKRYLKPKEIESCFDAGYYLRHVDRIFKRVGL